MHLLDLSTELLIDIVELLDEARDVLALGLSCKRLKDITIPFPLEYRSFIWPTHDASWIRGSNDVQASSTIALTSGPEDRPNPYGELGLDCEDWLSEEPRRWRAIRSLYVHKLGTRTAPRFMQGQEAASRPGRSIPPEILAQLSKPTTGGEEYYMRSVARLEYIITAFSKALLRVPHLTSLTWNWIGPGSTSPLWEAIRAQSSLKRLSFNIESHPLFLQSSGSTSEAITLLMRMLDDCPSLEQLAITAPVFLSSPDPLAHPQRGWFEDCLVDHSWSQLQKLELGQMVLGPAKGRHLAAFISRHRGLKQLRFTKASFPATILNRIALPHLTDFAFDTPYYAQFPVELLSMLPQFPRLQHLQFRNQSILEVLSAARPLKDRITGMPLNQGPAAEWKNIMFPASHVDTLAVWAHYFNVAPRLQTLVLRASGRLNDTSEQPNDSSLKMRLRHTREGLSLKEVFARVIDNAARVDSEVRGRGSTLDLWITCVRDEP
ncbi:hypothetical protein CALCODRAFT_492920 [Calocera cornea HHB12733]|uniref:F-box domain-containing protein n=1 Tax=Calocera cornea HHB12733 TaxID=1353952 RepID=A0A165HZA9_9BASI|nr:hypothetical protein CALCODRAFT_492920 [Calocera cornea HHB12733]